jgi:hypothetical protein
MREREHLLKEGQESLAKLKEPKKVIGEEREEISQVAKAPKPKTVKPDRLVGKYIEIENKERFKK